MDESLFDELVKSVRIAFRFGSFLFKAIRALTGLLFRPSKYDQLINEQRRADLYGENGRRPPESEIRAQVFRRRGDR